MDVETLILTLTITYTLSSYIGMALFSYMWRATHLDRIALCNNPPEELDEDELRRAKSIALRNVIVAGVLASTFALYSIAGTLGSIRRLEIIELPWTEGTLTTFLLVAANLLEMLIAWVLVVSRRSVNFRTDTT